MIEVTRYSGEKIYLNADLIEYVEATPDTIIALTTGKKYMVKEKVDQVVDKVMEYHRQISHLYGVRQKQGTGVEPEQS